MDDRKRLTKKGQGEMGDEKRPAGNDQQKMDDRKWPTQKSWRTSGARCGVLQNVFKHFYETLVFDKETLKKPFWV